MDTQTLGEHYTKIAEWWEEHHKDSPYGVEYVEQAIRRVKNKNTALDVGCGSGGRIIDTILESEFSLTALDVSEGMMSIAKEKHPTISFVNIDFMNWTSDMRFDLIVVWDSIFHASSVMQKPIVEKLCGHLAPAGILLFTAGGITNGDIVGVDMNGVGFEYGSLYYTEYLSIIEDCKCDIMTMTRDQPRHMVFICQKKENG